MLPGVASPSASNLSSKGRESMNRVLSSAIVVTGLVFMLSGAVSWGQVPNTNDTSDANQNTGGGTDALGGNASGIANTAYGTAALKENTASYNTAFGADALYGPINGNLT